MASTLTALVQRTITRLSMVAGVAVQVYAEERIAEMIWHKFVMVRDELWWDDFMTTHVLTQDVDGRPVENVVRSFTPPIPVGTFVINSFNDIQYIWAGEQGRPLKDLPHRANPLGVLKQGVTAYKMPDTVKVFRVAPYAEGRKMVVRARIYYPYFMPTDIVPMDDQVLILGAAYDYLEDDGTNAGQTEKFRNLFNDRLRQLKVAENDREIPLSPMPAPSSSGYQVVR